MRDRCLARCAVAFAVVALAACDPTPPWQRAPARGWTRYDLLEHRPRVDPAARVRTRIELLGPGALVGRGGERRRRRMAGEIRALEAPSGQELRWALDLGAEPFLSYVPLSTGAPGCRRLYRVRARAPDGAARDVDEHPAAAPGRFAPAAVDVPLDAFAGGRIELVLRLDAEGETCGSQAALWGEPAVYGRGEVAAPPGSGERPNVVLLGLDTLRADALGVYGHEPSMTPAIDRLAGESDVWLEAFSSFNVTNPSFASILTGLYGKNHGVYDLKTPLSEEHATLAELFAAAGYATGAVVSARHLDARQSGLGQGFGTYLLPRSQNAARLAADRAMEWIASRRRRFFLWLHFFDPHTPHTPPRPYASGYLPAAVGLAPVRRWRPFREPRPVEHVHRRLGAHRDLYAAEVAYLDHEIGRLLDFLASRGYSERTLVVLVADHGENLGEHGIDFRHGGLWDTTTRVPMMIRWPGAGAGRRIAGLVQTVDLFPTLLAAAGIAAPPSDGVDLRRLGKGRPRVFAEAAHRQGAMVRTATHLFFQAFTAQSGGKIAAGPYLYDLEEDPAEETNLADTGLEVEAELASTLRRWLGDRRSNDAPPAALSEEQLEELRALGYADD